MVKFFTILLFLSASVMAKGFPSVRALLKPQVVTSDLWGANPEYSQHPTRQKIYKASRGRNKKWYARYKKKHRDKTPLPYHPRLGVSQEEYAKLVELSKPIKVGTIKVVINDKGVHLSNLKLTSKSSSVKFPHTSYSARISPKKRSRLYHKSKWHKTGKPSKHSFKGKNDTLYLYTWSIRKGHIVKDQDNYLSHAFSFGQYKKSKKLYLSVSYHTRHSSTNISLHTKFSPSSL